MIASTTLYSRLSSLAVSALCLLYLSLGCFNNPLALLPNLGFLEWDWGQDWDRGWGGVRKKDEWLLRRMCLRICRFWFSFLNDPAASHFPEPLSLICQSSFYFLSPTDFNSHFTKYFQWGYFIISCHTIFPFLSSFFQKVISLSSRTSCKYTLDISFL